MNCNNSATKIQLIQSGMKLTGPAYSNNKRWMNGMETTKKKMIESTLITNIILDCLRFKAQGS